MPIIIEVLSKFNYSQPAYLEEICKKYPNNLFYLNNNSKQIFQKLINISSNTSNIICTSIRISLFSDKEFKIILNNTKNLNIYFIFNEKYLKFDITSDYYYINPSINFIYILNNPETEIINSLYDLKLFNNYNKRYNLLFISSLLICIYIFKN